MCLGMINFFLEKWRILSKRYIFLPLLIETGVETTPSAHPRGLQTSVGSRWRGGTVDSLSYLVPLSGELHRVMSCPKTAVFIYSCWWQSCHRPTGQGHGLLTVIPSSWNLTSQQLMRNGDRSWTPSPFSGTRAGSFEKHLTPPPSVYNTLIHRGLWKKHPGKYTENCWFGSSGDLILQGCPMTMVPGADCRRVHSEAWRYLPQHLNSYIREAQFLHKTLKKKAPDRSCGL